MASAELAIASAHLRAALMRADPTPRSKDDVEQFYELLDTTTLICSRANVQV